MCLGEILHGLALRKVLADQAIGVLIRATFPRVVGSSKVERDPGCVLDLSKAMELGSVISSDGFEQIWATIDELDQSAVERGHGAVSELADQNAA